VVSGRFDGKSTEEVFASIADISRYPELMDFVVEVEIESETATERVASAWGQPQRPSSMASASRHAQSPARATREPAPISSPRRVRCGGRPVTCPIPTRKGGLRVTGRRSPTSSTAPPSRHTRPRCSLHESLRAIGWLDPGFG